MNHLAAFDRSIATQNKGLADRCLADGNSLAERMARLHGATLDGSLADDSPVKKLYFADGLSAWCDINGKNSLFICTEKLLPADASWIHWIKHARMYVEIWLRQRLAEDFPPPTGRCFFSPCFAALNAGELLLDFDYLKRQSSAIQQETDRLLEFIRSAELHMQMPSGTGLPPYFLIPSEAFSQDAEFTPDMPDMEPIEWAVVLLTQRLMAAANLKEQLLPLFPSGDSAYESQQSPSAENSRKQRRKRTKAARKKRQKR